MQEKISEIFFALALLVGFFLIAESYNIAYFATIGDSFTYFLYIPIDFFDLIKTGLLACFIVLLFLMIFKPIMINPAFTTSFPNSKLIFGVAIALLFSNFAYFASNINSSSKNLTFIFEAALYIFAINCFFSIIYYFTRTKSRHFLLLIFFASLIPVALFSGWVGAKNDINSFSSETKSKILLSSDKVVSAKIIRSLEKGMLVMTDSTSSINFIGWNQIKEVKFKKVSSF